MFLVKTEGCSIRLNICIRKLLKIKTENINVINRKRKRGGKDPEVEEVLIKWFSEVRKENAPINSEILFEKHNNLQIKWGKATLHQRMDGVHVY